MTFNPFRGALVASAVAICALAPTNPIVAEVVGVSAAAEVKPEVFGKLPAVRDAAISPDGKKVALYGTFDGVPSMAVIDTTSGKLVTGVKLGKEIKPGWVRWANNDRILMSVWKTDRFRDIAYNMASIYTYSVSDNKGDFLIQPKRAGRTGSRIGSDDVVYETNYADIVDMLPDDPDHILMEFADEMTGVRSVHKVDVANGKYSTVQKATTSVQDWVTDNTGAVRVALGLNRGATQEEDVNIRIRDLDGEWKPLQNWPGIDHETEFHGFTNDPAEMVIGIRNGQDTTGLYVYDLRTKSVTRKIFHNPDYDVASVVRDTDTREVIGAQYVGDEAEVVLLPGHTRAMDAMTAAFSDYQVRYIDVSDGGDTLLFTVAQPYDPGALMLIRKGETRPTQIHAVRPGLASDELGLVIPVRYTARDGQKIPAFVTLPPTVNDTASIKDLPFIVYPHGGPRARDAKEFDYMAQFFASRGYGVLQMNFRGSTGYGESFAKAGQENWAVMRTDAVDGAKWLVEKGYADPDRMCIAGWSFGGYSALMSGVKDADKFKCVVAIASLSDLEGELRDMRDYRFSKIARRFITDGFRDKADMRENSPVRVADQMTLPTFIAHGTLDVNVDYDQHKRLVRALKKSPAKVTEMTFKEDDHYMSVEANRQAMLKGIAKFLESVNGKSEYMKK